MDERKVLGVQLWVFKLALFILWLVIAAAHIIAGHPVATRAGISWLIIIGFVARGCLSEASKEYVLRRKLIMQRLTT